MSANINSVSALNQLANLGSAAEMALKVTASGASSSSILSKKEYGKLYNLKGAELNNRHFEYKKGQMASNAKLVGAALLTGEIGITRLGVNKKGDGGTLAFKSLAAVVAPKGVKSAGPDVSKLSDDDILNEMIRRGITVAAE